MAITGVANVDFAINADIVNDVYRSDISNNSASWDIDNLVPGSVRTLTALMANISDCSYDPFTDRVWFIKNDTDDIVCYPRSSLYDNTASSSLVRTIELTGGAADTEGLDGPWWNASASAFECTDADEQGGNYYSWFREITEAQLVGSGDFSLADIQQLTWDATAVDNNSALEGIGFDKYGNVIWGAGEGQQPNTDRKVFDGDRPPNRTTNYTYLSGFTVRKPWDPEVEPMMTDYGADGAAADLAGVAYHAPTQTLVWLSQTGDYLVWTDTSGNILGDLDISSVGMFQVEGLCFIGDDLILCGETNEFVICVYTP